MGAIAEAIMAYAQPLIDESDGSIEGLNHAMAMAQFCYNLALSSEELRVKTLNEMKQSMELSDEEFEVFQHDLVQPMIARHHEMFPHMNRQASKSSPVFDPVPSSERSDRANRLHRKAKAAGEPYPDAKPYAPCPCDSGKKYKFCCKNKK